MGKTSIEWTAGPDGSAGKTWNPLRARHRETGKVGWACIHVSPGCEHCYSESFNAFRGTGLKYRAQDLKHVESFLDPRTLAAPLSWRKPCRCFVCSMTDLFAEWVPFEQIAAVFGVMASRPEHTFQLLTKRPERARDFFEWVVDWKRGPHHEILGATGACWTEALNRLVEANVIKNFNRTKFYLKGAAWPLLNAWLGCSVENQETADKRIPELLACPAAIRFISYEPALGPVDFTKWLRPEFTVHRGDTVMDTAEGRQAITAVAKAAAIQGGARFLDQIIVGGESGPRARPFELEWARSVIRQCRAAGSAPFVKQLGAQPVDGYLTAAEVIEGEKGLPRPTDQPLTEEVAAAILRETHLVDIPDGGFPRRIALKDRKGGDTSEWPESLRVRQFPEAKP